ncbi:hypothetical protein ABPG74_022393 [Tetrahymena malaccensis]
MDFLGIIQWVMDVQQYPDSYKDEIEKLKTECFNLSTLIKTIGEDQIPQLYQNQIKKHLEEAETLLKNVNHKVGLMQSVISMISGQQTIQKLKEAKDNIHNTIINLNAWMSSIVYSTNNMGPVSDLRISKVKKFNSNDSDKDLKNDNTAASTASSLQIPATLVDQLDPTYQQESEDEGEHIFGNSKKINVEITLDKNANIYDLFEEFKINTKQSFNLKLDPKVFFTFERITYIKLADDNKDVNRISREHADLELIEIEQQDDSHTQTVTLQVPMSEAEKQLSKEKQNPQSQSEHKTNTKEDDQFATCVEGFSDGEGDDLFAKGNKETPAKKQKHYYISIACKGPNGIFVYRKRENQQKQDELSKKKLIKDMKLVEAGQWVKVAKGEKALLFNSDSFAILKCDKIIISYTIKIE